LPTSASHALLLREGRTVAAGRANDVLTDGNVSACFGFPVRVRREEGRWAARASAGWRRTAAASSRDGAIAG